MEGCEGKPKGLLQILWERGLIDTTKLSQYTKDGTKDKKTGKIDRKFSLRRMMQQCTDFRNEETALQYLGRKLGVKVDCTPKFHCEMAGEGIEYCWAFSKALYRRKPLASKKSRDTFKKLVKECTSASILKPAQCKKFSRRARQYICAYYILHVRSLQGQEGAQPEEGRAGKQQLQFRSIERMKKLFQSHRCALDFDKGFVEAAIKESAAEAA